MFDDSQKDYMMVSQVNVTRLFVTEISMVTQDARTFRSRQSKENLVRFVLSSSLSILKIPGR